jgi:hypothetical protein
VNILSFLRALLRFYFTSLCDNHLHEKRKIQKTFRLPPKKKKKKLAFINSNYKIWLKLGQNPEIWPFLRVSPGHPDYVQSTQSPDIVEEKEQVQKLYWKNAFFI